MIEQAAGRRDQHVDAARQLVVLIVERDAADQQRDIEFVLGAVFFEVFVDLRREFARRLQDQRARHARAGAARFQHGEHRQHECCGLAGAGLRDAEHVAPGENVGYRLFLNGGGGRVASRCDGGENLFGQAELRERHETSRCDRPCDPPRRNKNSDSGARKGAVESCSRTVSRGNIGSGRRKSILSQCTKLNQTATFSALRRDGTMTEPVADRAGSRAFLHRPALCRADSGPVAIRSGNGRRPSARRHMDAIARRILAAAPPRFALVGLSMGGFIAYEILRRRRSA